MINREELIKQILILSIIPLYFGGMYLYATASERAQMPETKVGNDQYIEYNGITYINCARDAPWDTVRCYIVVNGTQIQCATDGIYSSGYNPLCTHIIIDHELNRRGL